jgi:hypothetical protein
MACQDDQHLASSMVRMRPRLQPVVPTSLTARNPVLLESGVRAR